MNVFETVRLGHVLGQVVELLAALPALLLRDNPGPQHLTNYSFITVANPHYTTS